MGARTEILGSRRRTLVGHQFMAAMHEFNVLDEVPEDAWKNSVPPLPGVGTHLNELQLADNPYSQEVIVEALNRGVQLRRIESDWFGNTKTHSRLTLHYASGLDEKSDPNRHVVWEDDSTLETETMFYDIWGVPIPDGAQRRVPVVNMVATLNGAILTFSALDQPGKVNSGPFRTWPPQTLLFTGATTRLIHGFDALEGGQDVARAVIQLTFQGRRDGWQEKRPILDIFGQPTGEFATYDKYEVVDFANLFPNGWDPGT